MLVKIRISRIDLIIYHILLRLINHILIITELLLLILFCNLLLDILLLVYNLLLDILLLVYNLLLDILLLVYQVLLISLFSIKTISKRIHVKFSIRITHLSSDFNSQINNNLY
jgi:hypothetical protein